jgi:hypothetical protein
MRTAIEALESRIAPATIFFDPTKGTFTDEKSKPIKSNAAAAGAADADFALLLKRGDKLVMDSTPTFEKTKAKGKAKPKLGNQVQDANSVALATVTAGSGILFFNDLDGKKISEGELTGIAVSEGFKGSVTGDVNGSIASLLSAGKKGKPPVFKTSVLTDFIGNKKNVVALQDDSISELKVTGRVTGHLLAGGSISNVNIGGAGDGLSVQSIATGAAANLTTISFNGGGKSFEVTAPRFTGDGGSIQNVVLGKGADLIRTSSGEGSAAGGSISGITIGSQAGDLIILAGDGAAPDAGNGGAGGSVSNIKVSGLEGDLAIQAGAGGDGGENKKGGNNAGNGGSVTAVEIASLASGSITITAGSGGYGGYSYGKNYTYFGGAGGQGGAVSQVTMTMATDLEVFIVAAGGGGDAQVDKDGGNGGSVTGLNVSGAGVIGDANIRAGDGGSAGDTGRAGNGGGVSNVRLPAEISTIVGGEGGDSGGAFQGGNGGSITDLVLSRVSGSVDNIAGDIRAGAGGDAGYSYDERTEVTSGAAGGSGGSIRNVTITGSDAESDTSLSFNAGAGGAGTINMNGGSGGRIDQVSINLAGVLSGMAAYAGAGGRAEGLGTGGIGGAVANFTVRAGAIGFAEVVAGNGGDGTAIGGAGGSLSSINLDADMARWGSAPTFVLGAGGAAQRVGAEGQVIGALEAVRSNYVAPLEEEVDDDRTVNNP